SRPRSRLARPRALAPASSVRQARYVLRPMLVGIVAVLVIVLAVAAVLAARALAATQTSRILLEQRLGGIEGQLEQRLGGVEGQLEQRLAGIEDKVDRRLEGIDGRILQSQRSAGQTATEIVDRLGKLDGTAAQMLQQAANLSR